MKNVSIVLIVVGFVMVVGAGYFGLTAYNNSKSTATNSSSKSSSLSSKVVSSVNSISSTDNSLLPPGLNTEVSNLPSLDACKVVALTAVQSAFGPNYQAGTSTGTTQFDTVKSENCFYYSDNTSNPAKSFYITKNVNTDSAKSSTEIEEFKKAITSDPLSEYAIIDNLGQLAYSKTQSYDTYKETSVGLYTTSGQYSLVLGYGKEVTISEKEIITKLTELAKTVK